MRRRDDAVGTEARPRWLAVGPLAARLLRGRSPVEAARDVHAALALPAGAPWAGGLVDARALRDRPRAALRHLLARVAPAPLLLVGDAVAPALRRAAADLDLPVLSPAEVGDGLAPARRRAPGDAPAPSLPRADRGGRPAPADPAGADLLAGCLARLDRPKALGAWLVERFAQESGAARVSLLLLERRRRSLALRAGAGLPAGLLGGRVRQKVTSGLAGRAIALGRPQAGRGRRGGPHGYRGEAWVLLPLGPARRPIGVLCLTDLPDDRVPGPDRLARWARLARSAGRGLAAARRLARAARASTRDRLTGLPNRGVFDRALGREMQRALRSGEPLAVAMIDLDHFKRVNDEHGHDAGDAVLVAAARRLAASFRATDLVCRWGGEEFAVLLTDLAPRGADAGEEAVRGGVREALRRAAARVRGRSVPLPAGRGEVTVRISGGFACCPQDGRTAEALLGAADQALLEAKRQGRDRICGA